MKKILILMLCVTTWGCARQATMQFSDLNHFVVNCNQAEQQMAFLQKQYANTSEFNRRQRAVISQAMREIRSYCMPKVNQDSGCLTVQEQLNASPAVSVVCRARGQKRAYINIWETEIDK